MICRIKLPRLGETMEEGTITAWHKRQGDPVSKGDVLFSVETDKSTVDVESFFTGELTEICCEAGRTVPVGFVVALLTT